MPNRVLAALLLCLALPAAAQDRTLSWDEIAVTARLDERGTLHVRERQTIVFNGEWNGGERSFTHRLNQDLDLKRIVRIGPDGREIPLVEGDTDSVDHYEDKAGTIRWRSRLPSDPPFDQTRITYVLDYAWSGILVRDGDVYKLDHDFGLPQVEWPIRRFVLDLELDPAWQPLAAVPAHLERRDLPPGTNVLVTADLRHTGAAAPDPGVSVVPLLWRRAAFAAALLAMAFLYLRFRQEEGRRGRFEPLPGPREWDEAWVRENVLDYLPEEVGALWDQKIGPPEVAAVLARMVAEGKLESRVTPGFSLLGISFSPGVLHLRLLVERRELAGYERALVDKLFLHADETDTQLIRKHYKSTGFDPSKVIAEDLEAKLGHRLGAVPAPSRRPTLYLLLAIGVLIVLDAVVHPLSTGILFAIVGFGLIWLWGPAALAAAAWRKRTERLDLGSLGFLVPGLLVCLWCAFFVFMREWLDSNTTTIPAFPGVLALALIPVAIWNSLLNNARSRESDGTIRKRRLLGTGRRLLRRELASAHPRLHDGWLPYLLAFGLGREVDRWFRAFGGASRGTTFTSTSSSGGSFGSGGSSGWSGGGGQFGGAGAMASWSVAAAGMASGVSAPSSSSSGGGGGGGSSGGGGGGGW